MRARPGARAAVFAGLAGLLLSACAAPGGPAEPCAGSSKPIVVAAENFWGSIAGQLAGDRACVASIIVNPNTDPHAYEAKPVDARLVASARYVIVNGAGYDAWAAKLIRANPAPGRTVLTIGDLVGKEDGDNPHLWYSPGYVLDVVARINSDLDAIDSAGATFFDAQAARYRSVALKDYLDTIAAIKNRYAGTPVGATESVFSYLADALGLDLVTPPAYLKAISEGTDPSPADRAAVERQISTRSIKAFVFNSQNSTRDVVALVAEARAEKIPVATITETLSPPGLTFQDWQTRQLRQLLAALGG